MELEFSKCCGKQRVNMFNCIPVLLCCAFGECVRERCSFKLRVVAEKRWRIYRSPRKPNFQFETIFSSCNYFISRTLSYEILLLEINSNSLTTFFLLSSIEFDRIFFLLIQIYRPILISFLSIDEVYLKLIYPFGV